MKRILLKYILAATAVVALALPASSQYLGTIRMDSCSMHEDGDSLKVNFRMHIDRQSAAWFSGTLLTPALTNGDPTLPGTQIVAMPNIMVQGKNKNRATERAIKLLGQKGRGEFRRPAATIRVVRNTDTLVRYDYAVPYRMWMDTARLSIYEEIINFRNERQLVVLSTEGVVRLIPRAPYEVKPQVNFITPAPEAKIRSKQGAAFLSFQVARTNIIPGFQRNPMELAKIRNTFAGIEKDTTAQITGLYIKGFASPEGSYYTNARLARDRASALKDYIVDNFRVPLRYDQIKISSVAEDWDGLRMMVAQSNMKDKAAILSIIDNTPDPDQRKVRLKALKGGAPYSSMLASMFPMLRRVEYRIDYSVKDFSVNESRTLVWTNPDALSQLELFDAAQSYGPGSKEYNQIMLDIIPRYFPDDATAAVNAAAVMIGQGDPAPARRLIEKHVDDQRIWNNLGVAYLLEGNMDMAEKLLQWAAAEGVPQAQANLDELGKKREDNLRMERYRNR